MLKPVVPIIVVLLLSCPYACHKETPLSQDNNFVPYTPAITHPLPGSTLGNCVPVQWQPVVNVAHYTLQVATDTVFSFGGSLLFQTELQAAAGSQLLNLLNGSYWLRLNAVNETGNSPWSALVPFAVYTQVPEDCNGNELIAPLLLLPEANAQLQGSEQTFTWQPVPGALHYRLQISGNENFSELLYNNTDLSLPLRTVQNFTPANYFWRVQALHDTRQSIWSEKRAFTILP